MFQTIRQALFGDASACDAETPTATTPQSPPPSHAAADSDADYDDEEEIQFLQEYGTDYGYGGALDAIREKEFPQMEKGGAFIQIFFPLYRIVPPPPFNLSFFVLKDQSDH